MDRRYYLAKFFLIVVATALALLGSGGLRAPHGLGHSQYTAPAQVQDATWHATVNAARVITCLVSRTVHRLA